MSPVGLVEGLVAALLDAVGPVSRCLKHLAKLERRLEW